MVFFAEQHAAAFLRLNLYDWWVNSFFLFLSTTHSSAPTSNGGATGRNDEPKYVSNLKGLETWRKIFCLWKVQ